MWVGCETLCGPGATLLVVSGCQEGSNRSVEKPQLLVTQSLAEESMNATSLGIGWPESCF